MNFFTLISISLHLKLEILVGEVGVVRETHLDFNSFLILIVGQNNVSRADDLLAGFHDFEIDFVINKATFLKDIGPIFRYSFGFMFICN